jgi:hypothetical protein
MEKLTAGELGYLENMFRRYGFHGTLEEQKPQRKLLWKVARMRRELEKRRSGRGKAPKEG